MKRRKKETERIVENHLGLFDSPHTEDIAASRDRTLERLRSAAADPRRDFSSPYASRRAVGPFKLIAVAAALVLAIALPWIVNRRPTLAVLESAQQERTDDVPTAGAQIAVNEPVRTSPGAGRVLKLSDGSTIEMRSNSELSVDRADDGLLIHLTRGDAIVNAVKQHSPSLCADKTCKLESSVRCSVSAVKEGSRVAVIEGDARFARARPRNSCCRARKRRRAR
jgi:ferric-dicitrate binding protein FerR (iron transport regulator)